MNVLAAVGMVLLVVTLAGCAAGSTDPERRGTPTAPALDGAIPTSPEELRPSRTTPPAQVPPSPGATGTPAGFAEPTVPEPTIDPALRTLVQRARDDLAARLGIPGEGITSVAAITVVWPDAASGCPQPGMAYAQVPQDGAVIELRADERYYRYHTGGNRTDPFPCDQHLQTPLRPQG